MARRQVVPALDGIRAVAVLMVFAFHVYGNVAPYGLLGVDAFFVLSGFLITGLLLDEQARTGAISFRFFYRNRALRLYPALVAFLVVTLLPARLVGQSWRVILERTVEGAVYLQDFVIAGLFAEHTEPDVYGHLWSLAVEEQFYIVWPVLLVLGLRWVSHRSAAIAALLGVSIAARAVTSHVIDGRAYFLPTGHLDALFAGVLLASLLRGSARPVVSRVVRRSALVWPAALAMPVAAFLIGVPHGDWLNRGLGFGLDLTVVAVIAHVVLHGGSLGAVLSWMPLRWLGRRSYGFYLYHPVVYRTFVELVPVRAVVTGPVVFVLTLLMVEMSWRFVEQPFLRRKRHVAAVSDDAAADPPVSGSGGSAT